ncbi:MAG: FkbM family methyltransferase [Phycisphaerae bacterium]|nr:FkbM family methyltransferase [Phycisphaerae bacterium]
MSNRFSSLLKKKILGKNKNLISVEEPYDVIVRLLEGHKISGVIDAGASNGHISSRLLKRFPAADVYAFEPNELYRQQLTDFAVREKRFHPFFAALSDNCGTADLNITESAGNTSLCTPAESLTDVDPVGAAVKTIQQVQILTIDQWAKDNDIKSIEVMKFDIQAYELAALKGATETLRNSTLLVYSEVWFNPVYKDGALFSGIDIFLRENGFALFDIFKPKYDPKGKITWANAIFIQKEKLGL